MRVVERDVGGELVDELVLIHGRVPKVNTQFWFRHFRWFVACGAKKRLETIAREFSVVYSGNSGSEFPFFFLFFFL